MRFPKSRISKGICLELAFIVFYLGVVGTAVAQITEVSLDVHLRIINRCSMTVNATDGDTSVSCNRPVAYRVSIRPAASSSSDNGMNRVIITY